MVLPATNPQKAGKKKPTVNAADTARVGYSRKSDAMINESNTLFNGLDITVMAHRAQGGQQ